ncbi:MAG: M64 family metallopeptidase [Candidatus Acidiferrum sp.]
MKNASVFRMLCKLVLVLGLVVASVKAQPVTKVVDHGPDGEKLTFVVLGDGYAAGDQAKYAQDVQRLVVNGVFGHDFYKENVSAFNVYRVDLVSKDSGVSTLTDSRDTALKVVYSGDWNRCWLEESAETDQLIIDATGGVKKADFILIVANEGGYGGCQRGGRLYITAGDNWDVVAHEYGHGIAGLYDEYTVGGIYTDPPINIKNCSTVLDRNGVSWRRLIDAATPLPSDSVASADPNQTVGMFTGCDYATKGIYRPVKECRMKSNTPRFCPVCLGLMKNAVSPYLTAAPAPGRAATESQPTGSGTTYVNMVMRISKDKPPQILRATQLSGRVISRSNSIPSYLFAFTKKGRPSYVQYLPDNPFTVRGFIDPKHPERGEKLLESETATVIVNVPNTDMSSATRDLGLQVFSVSPAGMDAFARSESIDVDLLLRKLKNNKAISMKTDFPASELGQAVKSIQ